MLLSNKSLTTIVRVIGCICLVGSVMVTTQIIADLVYQRYGIGKQIETVGIWTLHCSQYMRRENHLLTMAVYVFLYSLSSGLLIAATYMQYRLLVLPWLLCELLCIISDCFALMAIYSGKEVNVDQWQHGAMLFGLCFTLITWGLVFEAQRVWGSEKRQRNAGVAPPPYSEQNLEEPLGAGTPKRTFAMKMYSL